LSAAVFPSGVFPTKKPALQEPAFGWKNLVAAFGQYQLARADIVFAFGRNLHIAHFAGAGSHLAFLVPHGLHFFGGGFVYGFVAGAHAAAFLNGRAVGVTVQDLSAWQWLGYFGRIGVMPRVWGPKRSTRQSGGANTQKNRFFYLYRYHLMAKYSFIG
jgi:hypothetical protein